MQIKKSNILFITFVCFVWATSTAQQLDPILQDLIHKGINKSYSLQINNLERKQTAVDQKMAKSIFLPKITVNGSYTRLDDDIRFDDDTQNLLIATQKLLIKEAIGIPFNDPFPESIPLTEISNLQNKNILKTSIDLDWVLFSGQEASHALKASKHKEASFNYLGMAKKDKIAISIIETYDKLALVYASKRILTSSEKLLKKQEYYVKKAIENGLATPIHRKKIELAQQQLAGKVLEFNQNKTLLIEVLSQLTGENKNYLNTLHPSLHPFAINATLATKKRYELKALEEAEKATDYKSKMEKSNFIPKLAIKGHYELLEDDLSLFDPKWYVGAGIKWNLFDGNQAHLKSKKTKLESRKYQAQIAETNELIHLSVIKAQLSYESALQNTQIIQKEIELAYDTYKMIDRQYTNNLASINDVLAALNDLEKANFKLQNSYFKQRKAVTELLHAKGILTY
ncbi:TolC family protein [Flavicella sediminum]|uniref:TolC family protein n=1 Tax=Flavicella sediminum TaxID=2585141 RepID=UPI00111EF3D5|nr:TolC family protein [Flavicella sediminum]